MKDPIDSAWLALCECLDRRSRELRDDVRAYPTPIARCDEHLTKVIEERDGAFRRLRRANELEQVRVAVARDAQRAHLREFWCGRMREFVAGFYGADDEFVTAARDRVLAALRSS